MSSCVCCLIVCLFNLLAYCDQNNIEAYGGEMRVQGRLEDFSEKDFKRAIAILLDSEITDIYVLGTFQGVKVDFQIGDPSLEEVRSSTATSITRLRGDEKMMLLYHWWITNDSHFETFPYDVISFVVYGENEESGVYTVADSPSIYHENNIIQGVLSGLPRKSSSEVVYLEIENCSSLLLTMGALFFGVFLCFVCL